MCLAGFASFFILTQNDAKTLKMWRKKRKIRTETPHNMSVMEYFVESPFYTLGNIYK